MATATRLLEASCSTHTRKAYQAALKCLESFRLESKRPAVWPAPVEHVRAFIAYLANKHTSPSTASTYLAGIAFFHKFHNWPDPTKEFQVTSMLKGFRKLHSRPDQRVPLTLSMLQDIISKLPVICQNAYESSLFKAAFLTCFFGLLRVSELTAPTKTGTSPLLRCHLSFAQNLAISLLITRSKTDQFRKGHLIKLQPNNIPNLCPCLALHDFCKNYRNPIEGPLFLHTDSTPLTAFQFSALLKKCASAAKLNTKHLSSHSFRIGACSFAAALGLQVSDIKKLGRWSSRAFTSYIRI